MECNIVIEREGYVIDPITTNLMKGRWNEKVSPHKHPVFHLIYILEGNGRVTIDATTTKAEPGMLFIIRPNQVHGFLFGEEQPMTNFECTFRLLNRQGEAVEADIARSLGSEERDVVSEHLAGKPFQVPTGWEGLLSEGFLRIIEGNEHPAERPFCSFLIGALLAKVLNVIGSASRIDSADVPVDQKIAAVKQFMLLHRHRAVSLKEMAESIHVTPNHLCKIFKKHTGDTPQGHFAKLRMREAARLLSYTDLPIYVIAEKLGYDDPSYFGKAFRSIHDLSPQAYRRNKLFQERG